MKPETIRVAICCLFRAYGGTAATLPVWLGEWTRQIGDRGLPLEILVYTCPQNLGMIRQAGVREIRIVEVPLAGRGLLGRIVAEMLVLPLLLRRDRVGVVLGIANTLPWLAARKSIVIFQNAAPFVREACAAARSVRFRLRMVLLRWAIILTARRSSRIICISGWFREMLCGCVSGLSGKATVIRHGVASTATEATSPSPNATQFRKRLRGGRFVLSVSHGYPYKNLTELLHGFDMALARLPMERWQLMIAGELLVPSYRLALERTVGQSERLKDAVVLAGSLSEGEVRFLTQCCDVFAFSSCCENWPVALMNALAAGAPVACSNVGVMPEVVGDAAVLFDPFRPAAIAEALLTLMSSREAREEYRAKSIERARAFHTAEQQAVRILEEVCSLSGLSMKTGGLLVDAIGPVVQSAPLRSADGVGQLR